MSKRGSEAGREVPDKLFPYIQLPEERTPPFLGAEIDLQGLFSTCNAELGLQQSKRDQLIAFYLTVSGLSATYAMSSAVSTAVRVGVFIMLFVIGTMWSTIALRYRIYKEVYWLSCRTISSLYAADRNRIDKALVQHNFYETMCKCMRGKLRADGKTFDFGKIVKSNLTSSEMLLFMTLVFFSALTCGMAVLTALTAAGLILPAYILAVGVFLVVIGKGILDYNRRLADLYAVVCDRKDRSFNRAFEKAWELHIFL